jgi:hypothetical protein
VNGSTLPQGERRGCHDLDEVDRESGGCRGEERVDQRVLDELHPEERNDPHPVRQGRLRSLDQGPDRRSPEPTVRVAGQTRTTIGRADLVVRKVEFHDAEGVVKVLEVKRTEKTGAVTLPVESTMTNVKRGSSTTLEILSHQLDVPKDKLPDDTFTRAFLERG